MAAGGVAELVERHLSQAKRLATELEAAGFTILNRVVLNQILATADDDETTAWIREEVEKSGEAWFGSSTWDGKAAFRLSVSSWRTADDDIGRLIALLSNLRQDAKAKIS